MKQLWLTSSNWAWGFLTSKVGRSSFTDWHKREIISTCLQLQKELLTRTVSPYRHFFSLPILSSLLPNTHSDRHTDRQTNTHTYTPSQTHHLVDAIWGLWRRSKANVDTRTGCSCTTSREREQVFFFFLLILATKFSMASMTSSSKTEGENSDSDPLSFPWILERDENHWRRHYRKDYASLQIT